VLAQSRDLFRSERGEGQIKPVGRSNRMRELCSRAADETIATEEEVRLLKFREDVICGDSEEP
jgi:hypothetical protein